MPLLRGIARAAIVSGTATAVSNRVSRRQAQRWSEQEALAGPPAAPDRGGPSRVEQLTELAELRDRGALTDEEFAAEKAKLLG
jgi:Short C-terminal domain